LTWSTRVTTWYFSQMGVDPAELPAGVVTFLFTDIGGSTRLLQRWGDEWSALLDRHRQIVRDAVAKHDGVEVRTEGDSFFVAFADPVDAVLATADAQAAMTAEAWPAEGAVSIRAGLHTGYAVPQDGDYVALPVHQAARVASAAYAGQTLVSESTQRAVSGRLPSHLDLVDLGTHRLKDFDVPQALFELRWPGAFDAFPPLETSWRGETNLPLQRTSFIGRHYDVQSVIEMFDSTRIVTITGPGGAGKTRLSVQVGAAMLDGSGDGVWLTELATVSEPSDVPVAVATALAVSTERDRPIADALVDGLRNRRIMLLVDNCEHVITACASLIDLIVRTCPQVYVLATSRQPLGVEGERLYRLSPLGVPPDDPGMTPDEALDFESVQLFVERARAHQPNFVLDAASVPAVTSICRRLEGMPLAIELAAARTRSLPPQSIDEALDDQFQLLTGGHRLAQPRQQSMRAMVDWSYALLTEDERWSFDTLAAFTGGWDLDAAKTVAAEDAAHALDRLASLVDQSLVQAEIRGSDVRYSMLEVVRQYAAERLAQRGDYENAAVRRRHRTYYLDLVERARRELDTAAQQSWLERLDVESANLRAAFSDALDDRDGGRHALRFTAALARYWLMRGRAVEGMGYAERALAKPTVGDVAAERAAALLALASLNSRSGNFARAQALIGEVLDIRGALDDDAGCAEALNDLAWLATRRDDYATARGYAERALALLGDADRPHLRGRIHATLGDMTERVDLHAGREHFELARRYFDQVGDRGASTRVLNNLGLIDLSLGDLSSARQALEQCLTTFSEMQDAAAVPTVLSNLGLIALEERDYPRALELFSRGLTLGHRTRDKELMVYTVLGTAIAVAALGDPQLGGVLHGAVDTLADDLGMVLDHLESTLRDRSIAELRLALGDSGFEEATEEGRSLSIEDAVERALGAAERSGSATVPGQR
jgi:predicted ATPase/class 3 adenylate cyclase